jgi:hypothetical protein
MPNWCQHEIRISGTFGLAELDRQLTAEHDDIVNPEHVSLLAALAPIPTQLADTNSPNWPPHTRQTIDEAASDELRDSMLADNATHLERCAALKADFGADNWYDWCLQHWGTKWPDVTYRYQRKPRSVVLYGECAWTPPRTAHHIAATSDTPHHLPLLGSRERVPRQICCSNRTNSRSVRSTVPRPSRRMTDRTTSPVRET